MSEQLTMEEFMGGSTSINSFGEQHLACVLLLDTSGSMSGDSIKNLNSAIARFKENVNRDPIARNRVDVAIVSFSTGVEVVSDFMPDYGYADAGAGCAGKNRYGCRNSDGD